jgi:hypothetical protein
MNRRTYSLLAAFLILSILLRGGSYFLVLEQQVAEADVDWDCTFPPCPTPTPEPPPPNCVGPDPSGSDCYAGSTTTCTSEHCDGSTSSASATGSYCYTLQFDCINGRWQQISCTCTETRYMCMDQSVNCGGRGPGGTVNQSYPVPVSQSCPCP